jgi:uncharacterized membrane protein YraQ (UPF0718 family)
MAPYLLIIVFSVLGFFIKGVAGLIIGGVGGYFISFIIGRASLEISKGLIPYSARRAIAQDMIKEDRETTEAYSEQKDINAVADFIATDIEQLFRESFGLHKTPENYWMSYPVITAMITSRIDESSGVEKKYNQLLRNSVKLMYPAHRNQ